MPKLPKRTKLTLAEQVWGYHSKWVGMARIHRAQGNLDMTKYCVEKAREWFKAYKEEVMITRRP